MFKIQLRSERGHIIYLKNVMTGYVPSRFWRDCRCMQAIANVPDPAVNSATVAPGALQRSIASQ